MLLTGQANFDDLCEVVRRGEIFRLLGKPCSPDALDKIYSKPFANTS